MQNDKFNNFFKSVSEFFGILSNPDRIRILGLIKQEEMDVNEIHNALGIAQSRVSQHLKLLKLNSLVTERREGKHVFYKVKNKNISKVVETAFQMQMLGFIADPESISVLNELINMWHI